MIIILFLTIILVVLFLTQNFSFASIPFIATPFLNDLKTKIHNKLLDSVEIIRKDGEDKLLLNLIKKVQYDINCGKYEEAENNLIDLIKISLNKNKNIRWKFIDCLDYLREIRKLEGK